MAHTTLYRRFRPLTFDQIIGQLHTVNTLTNQLKNNALSHAYLFIGSRGTGKTSTAKILARAVNCQNPNGINPCNNCDTCQSILNDANMDVFEMDAASNNGVDDIRDLKHIVKFPPNQAKYKVIIIDEVHMLSDGAFNALLKTLEEPPNYMLFILATTEPHKIPATILSRCQRYDFNRITAQQISDALKTDCIKLDINAEDSSIQLIARLADGSLRDGRSLLEQCISHVEGNLTYNNVSDALGKATDLELITLADAILTQQDANSLDSLNAYYKSGKDISALFTDLIYLFRAMLRWQVSSDKLTQNISESHLDFISSVSGGYSKTYIIGILQALLDTYQKIKISPYAWVTAELALLNLSEDVDQTINTTKNPKNKLLGVSKNMPVNTETSIKKEPPLHKPELNRVQKTPTLTGASDILEIWNEILLRIQDMDRPTYSLIKHLQPESLVGDKLKFVLNEDVLTLKNTIETPHNIKLIERVYSDVTGQTCIVSVHQINTSQNYKDQISSLFKNIAPDATITME